MQYLNTFKICYCQHESNCIKKTFVTSKSTASFIHQEPVNNLFTLSLSETITLHPYKELLYLGALQRYPVHGIKGFDNRAADNCALCWFTAAACGDFLFVHFKACRSDNVMKLGWMGGVIYRVKDGATVVYLHTSILLYVLFMHLFKGTIYKHTSQISL